MEAKIYFASQCSGEAELSECFCPIEGRVVSIAPGFMENDTLKDLKLAGKAAKSYKLDAPHFAKKADR